MIQEGLIGDMLNLKGVFHNNCHDFTIEEARAKIKNKQPGEFYFIAKQQENNRIVKNDEDKKILLIWKLNNIQIIYKDIKVLYFEGQKFPKYEIL